MASKSLDCCKMGFVRSDSKCVVLSDCDLIGSVGNF